MPEGGSVIAPASNEASGSSDTTQADTLSGSAPDETQAAVSEPATNDDPEFELDEGLKLKKSELRDLVKRRKEMDRGANERFQEAAKLRKEAEAERAQAQALVSGLSKDTKAALRAAGIDPIKFAEQALAEALEEHQLTPEQKRLRELEAREKAREEEEAQRKADADAQQEAQAVDYFTDQLSGAFLGALQSLKLPDDDLPEAVARMSQRFEALMDAGEPIDVMAIAEDVRDRMFAAPKHRFQSLSDEELLRQYPEEAERFRKALLKQTQTTKQPATTAARDPMPKPKKGLTRAELEARIAQRLGA
jgi:hypothetical protein